MKLAPVKSTTPQRISQTKSFDHASAADYGFRLVVRTELEDLPLGAALT
jgi:hypothetical protein